MARWVGWAMNENDLRDCFAMFAMAGWIMNGDYSKEEIPHLAYQTADAMLEARKPKEEVGITAVKRRKKND
jgi:hypothetical protein